jgi:dienelactone hydrolase
MMRIVGTGCLALALVLTGAPSTRAQGGLAPGPWNLANLRQAPQVTWVDGAGPVRKLYYTSVPYKGRPTRVFAYYAEPAGNKAGKLPAVVLVHGGDGRAFAEWAQQWAARGYVALAMDLNGNGPDGVTPLPDGGPPLSGPAIFPTAPIPLSDLWPYQAVANVIRAVTLVSNLPQVDPQRVGVVGISWGGYLTCIVSGVDERVKAACPIYGCGYLLQDSYWMGEIAALPADWRATWLANFDPAIYLPRARAPMLFVGGTNDAAYPRDSHQASLQLVRDRRQSVQVNLPHNYPTAWGLVEPFAFMDGQFRGGKGLPVLLPPSQSGGRTIVLSPMSGTGTAAGLTAFYGARPSVLRTVVVSARVRSPYALAAAQVNWTTDTGPWPNRRWASAPATVSGGAVRAELPADPRLVYYLSITDARGATVSTDYRRSQR